MLVSGIKSKPIYEPLRADIRGRYHVMLGLGPGGSALLRVLGELRTDAPALLTRTRVLFVPDTAPPPAGTPGTAALNTPNPLHAIDTSPTSGVNGGVGTNRTDTTNRDQTVERLSAFAPAELRVFGDRAALLTEFRAVLEQSVMGTRLYVAGPENFIGLAMQIALEFNLNKDEVSAEELGTLARRVHCVHCRTTTENVTTNIVRCDECSRWLLVRDHYSRRLAAYMGVMVDAEAPGELPPIKEVFA